MTFESLLEHWEQSEAKYFLRKAFGLMLNTSSQSEEPEYAQIVLETLEIILFEMKLGLDSVLCCILKNIADNRRLSLEAIEQDFGKPARSLPCAGSQVEMRPLKSYYNIFNSKNQ